MIEISGLTKSYSGKTVLDRIALHVHEGEMLGIIGPNGTGKSTMLKLISGVETPDQGSIKVNGRPLNGYSRKALARMLAVLQQEALPPVGFTVRETVEMGRYPFQNWLGDEKGSSGDLIDSILSKLNLTPLAERTLEHLSGGERQRVALAKAMAQQPKLLLLDEPTTYLDIGYQVQMMDLVKRWQKDEKLTVVAVLHDLNLAAQYCDRLLLLHGGRIVRIGTPWDVLEPELLAGVYETEPIIAAHPSSGVPQVLLQPRWMV